MRLFVAFETESVSLQAAQCYLLTPLPQKYIKDCSTCENLSHSCHCWTTQVIRLQTILLIHPPCRIWFFLYVTSRTNLQGFQPQLSTLCLVKTVAPGPLLQAITFVCSDTFCDMQNQKFLWNYPEIQMVGILRVV